MANLENHDDLIRAVRNVASSGAPFYEQHGGIGVTVSYRYVDDVREAAQRLGYEMTNQEHIVSLGQGQHDSLTFKRMGRNVREPDVVPAVYPCGNARPDHLADAVLSCAPSRLPRRF